jgi:ABC-2 type transport system permease protein
MSIKPMVAFVVFYHLRYAFYSALDGAIGAMVNSEQEVEQVRFILVMPLGLAVTILIPVGELPNSPLALLAPLFPLALPAMMFMRHAMERPASWHLALSATLCAAIIYGLLRLCGRIYREGILRVGKKPTLPEIAEWIRYA